MADMFFSRYTDLPSLIHILKHRELTLLDPATWDDKNDSKFVELYRQKCGLKSVLALCFTRAPETYHHWRVFAPTSSGVCIRFGESALRESVSRIRDLRLREVAYLRIAEARTMAFEKDRLPFLKRYPFKPESEVRLLWESATETRSALPVPIGLDAIARITLSPWLHPSLIDGVKSVIKGMAGCDRLKVYRSTLVGNADWLGYGAAAR